MKIFSWTCYLTGSLGFVLAISLLLGYFLYVLPEAHRFTYAVEEDLNQVGVSLENTAIALNGLDPILKDGHAVLERSSAETIKVSNALASTSDLLDVEIFSYRPLGAASDSLSQSSGNVHQMSLNLQNMSIGMQRQRLLIGQVRHDVNEMSGRLFELAQIPSQARGYSIWVSGGMILICLCICLVSLLVFLLPFQIKKLKKI